MPSGAEPGVSTGAAPRACHCVKQAASGSWRDGNLAVIARSAFRDEAITRSIAIKKRDCFVPKTLLSMNPN